MKGPAMVFRDGPVLIYAFDIASGESRVRKARGGMGGKRMTRQNIAGSSLWNSSFKGQATARISG